MHPAGWKKLQPGRHVLPGWILIQAKSVHPAFRKCSAISRSCSRETRNRFPRQSRQKHSVAARLISFRESPVSSRVSTVPQEAHFIFFSVLPDIHGSHGQAHARACIRALRPLLRAGRHAQPHHSRRRQAGRSALGFAKQFKRLGCIKRKLAEITA